MRLFAHQLIYELRTFRRNVPGLFFVLGLPLLLFVIFTTLNGTDEIDGRRFVDTYLPAMIAFGLINATYGHLTTKVVLRRDSGLLKRVRATPLPLATMLAAMLVGALVVVVGVTALLLMVGGVAYGADLPQRWGSFAIVILVGGAAFSALGLLLASFVPRPEATDPMVYGTLLPLLFISGIFDRVAPHSALAHVADVFPVRHLFEAALETTRPGASFPLGHLAVVALWGAVAAVLATRCFRWEPR